MTGGSAAEWRVFLEIAAALLVIALLARRMLLLRENRRLYARLTAAYAAQGQGLAQRVAELEWLRDVSRQITAARTLERVLEITYDAIRAGLGFDRAGINLFNYEEGTFEDWIGTDAAGQKTWPPDRTLHLSPDSALWRLPGIAATLRGEDIYYTANATAECPLELRYLYDGEPTHNLMVSLRIGARVLGCISVDNLLSGRPIAPQDAKPIQALASQVAQAVERTRAEQARRASEERLRTVVQTAPIVLLTLDRRGVFTLSAGGGREFLGYPVDALAGVALDDAFPDQPALAEGFARALEGTAHTSTIEQHGHVVELHWVPERDATAAIAGVIGVAIDVADRAKAQREAERARRTAEELAALRSDFVAAVSHELRTPLTGIIGYSELLQARWSGLDEAQRLEYARRVALSARRQQQLVEDLLLLGRMEYGEQPPHTESVVLAWAVQRAAEEVQGSYRGQQIDQDGPGDLRVRADPDRLLQIVVNLMDNAAKYSPEGATIGVSWRAEGTMVAIRVRDRGRGIPAEGRHLLFTRFGRVPGSRTRAGRVGTGLGLYLGRQLAETMGGNLDLESTGPEGSVFRLSLPLVPD